MDSTSQRMLAARIVRSSWALQLSRDAAQVALRALERAGFERAGDWVVGENESTVAFRSTHWVLLRDPAGDTELLLRSLVAGDLTAGSPGQAWACIDVQSLGKTPNASAAEEREGFNLVRQELVDVPAMLSVAEQKKQQPSFDTYVEYARQIFVRCSTESVEQAAERLAQALVQVLAQ